MVVGYFAVQGYTIQPGGISGKTGVSLQKGDAFRHFLENILRNITASGSGIGHHFLLVQALRYGKRLVRRKVQFRVGFLLQRGQVVQKRRLLGGFFPFNGLHCKLPGIHCPLQGGYGIGLLLPSGGRLGGETYSSAGGAGFELPELSRDKILVLQIAVAYHY